MGEPLTLEYSRTYPVPVETAYDATIGVPLEELFDRRYLLVAPIRGTEAHSGHEGPWGTVGQVRTIRLGDGSSMREELLEVARPSHFGYHLDTVTGPLRAVLGSVDGRWAFEPAGTGTRVSWTWHVALLQPQARLVAAVLPGLWRGFARQGFERLEQRLLTAV